MKITSVSVHMGRKVTRNYNSFDNSVGVAADLVDGEDHREAILQLQKECLQQLFREDPLEAARRAAQKKTAAKEDTQG